MLGLHGTLPTQEALSGREVRQNEESSSQSNTADEGDVTVNYGQGREIDGQTYRYRSVLY